MADVLVEHDVAAAMRDGTVLRADVYRPVGDRRWPVLLVRLPYGKQMPTLIALLDPLAAARWGFVVVIQDTWGRFASDGDWEPWTFEENDGYDTVPGAAELPGSNGNVGMFGGGYFGNVQWMAALSKPPELKAIAEMRVMSSNFPRRDRNLNTGEPINRGTNSRPADNEVVRDAVWPSRIVLPVVPAAETGSP